jgi:hypothetical protein
MDLSTQYNTTLSPEEEAAYQVWALQNKRQSDVYDYDMRGWYKANQNKDVSGGQHFPDTFKKPNHPTFSNESMYNGVDGHQGGQWSGSEGSYSFTPGVTNLEMYSPLDLQKYFEQVEPGTKLVFPGEQ